MNWIFESSLDEWPQVIAKDLEDSGYQRVPKEVLSLLLAERVKWAYTGICSTMEAWAKRGDIQFVKARAKKD